MSNAELDPSTLIDTMKQGVEQLADVKHKFDLLNNVESDLRKRVDFVDEAEAFFDGLHSLAPSSMMEAIMKRAQAQDEARHAGYAGLVLAARDKTISTMMTAWTEQEEIQALIGTPVTLRAARTSGPSAWMSYDGYRTGLFDHSYITGKLKSASLFREGTITLEPGQYARKSKQVNERGNYNEGMVQEMFYLRDGIVEPRVQIETASELPQAAGTL